MISQREQDFLNFDHAFVELKWCSPVWMYWYIVLNYLPIDVMRESNLFGTVMAIDVVAPTGLKVKSGLSPVVSGWRLAAQKMLPWAKPPATLLTRIHLCFQFKDGY
jgi:hypothetical protein